jgi:hypothetical protein
LLLGRKLAKVTVIATGKGGGSDPIRCEQCFSHNHYTDIYCCWVLTFVFLRFSKGLEKAGLPGLDDLKKIIK